jgi:hypothetical protein
VRERNPPFAAKHMYFVMQTAQLWLPLALQLKLSLRVHSCQTLQLAHVKVKEMKSVSKHFSRLRDSLGKVSDCL